MGKLSRDSGADGERQVARLFRAYGFEKAERGVQRDGRTGHADVIGVPGIYIEVKFHRSFTRRDLEKAFDQVEDNSDALARDTGMHDIIPVVIWKEKGSRGWNVSMRTIGVLDLFKTPPFVSNAPLDGIVTMSFDDFIRLYASYVGGDDDGTDDD